MSVRVDEIDDGLYRVRWTTDAGHGMRKGETFRVDCTPDQSFVVSCVRDTPPPSHAGRSVQPAKLNRRTATQLRLQVVAGQRPDSANSSTEDGRAASNPPLSGYRLVSVWTRGVSADSKLYLKQLDEGAWILNSRSVDVDEQESAESGWTFTVKLWLKFERPSPAKNALNQLLALLANQKWCDTVFQLSNGEKLGAHKVVLAARSPTFAELVANWPEDGRIRVDDVAAQPFKHLLHYVYSTEHLEPLTVPKAMQLLSAADTFKVYDLRDECTNFMLSHIDVDNVVDLLMWAREHSAIELEEACSAFVVWKGRQIAGQDGYERLMKKHPDLCLRLTREMLAVKKTEHPASEAVEQPVGEQDEMGESDTSESPIESDCLFNYF